MIVVELVKILVEKADFIKYALYFFIYGSYHY